MVISFVSDSNGTGKSILSILLSEYLGQITDKSLLVDLNRHEFSDIEYYLSESSLITGLDDYINTLGKKIATLEDCVYKKNDHLHLMGTSSKESISEEHLQLLISDARHYKNLVFDCNSNAPDYILKASDLIILIVTQERKKINSKVKKYLQFSHKVAVVINKYDEKIDYKQGAIQLAFDKLGFSSKMFYKLPYSYDVVNQSNLVNVLSLISTNNNFKDEFIRMIYKLNDDFGLGFTSQTYVKVKRKIGLFNRKREVLDEI